MHDETNDFKVNWPSLMIGANKHACCNWCFFPSISTYDVTLLCTRLWERGRQSGRVGQRRGHWLLTSCPVTTRAETVNASWSQSTLYTVLILKNYNSYYMFSGYLNLFFYKLVCRNIIYFMHVVSCCSLMHISSWSTTLKTCPKCFKLLFAHPIKIFEIDSAALSGIYNYRAYKK